MRVTAKFRIYLKYEDCSVIGIVDKVDPYTRTIYVDGENFNIDDIIGANHE